METVLANREKLCHRTEDSFRLGGRRGKGLNFRSQKIQGIRVFYWTTKNFAFFPTLRPKMLKWQVFLLPRQMVGGERREAWAETTGWFRTMAEPQDEILGFIPYLPLHVINSAFLRLGARGKDSFPKPVSLIYPMSANCLLYWFKNLPPALGLCNIAN